MPEYDLHVRHRIYLAQLCAYLLIVTVAAVTFQQLHETSDNLCRGATENRQALRSLVVGVGNLGENLIIGDAAQGDFLTPQQTEALERVDAFEKEQLKSLELPICDR